MLNVFRGSKVNPSVFGIKVCSTQDWFGIGLFVFYCMCVTYYSVMMYIREQKLKLQYGSLSSSELLLTNDKIIKLLVFSFLGGWISGALGMGGGSVFNPLLLSLGVPP